MKHPTLDLSIILPVYEEAQNLPPLHRELTETLHALGHSYEIVAVDDGSRDGSAQVLREMAQADPNLHIICFRRNFGQSAAFQAGFDYARGRVVFTMDADGQNDPADIPALLAELEQGDFDLVGGWRQERKEPFLTRRLPSMIANLMIRRTSKIALHDRGCSLRAYKYDLVKQMQLYGEMHRFIPELASQIGARMSEVPVNDRKRRFGRSKYNISRTLRVLLDLFTIAFLLGYQARPMQFFGLFGLGSSGLGVLIGAYLVISKIVRGLIGGAEAFKAYQIGTSPWLMLAVLLIVLGAQFLTMGLLGELITRAYHEAQGKTIYAIRECIGFDTDEPGTNA
ncbi:MAG: glycosyltransferase family 2 protein [Anaerolineae bacterium]|nr:glycosyltransferase family 2 protein [Anaerolineae bacterium]